MRKSNAQVIGAVVLIMVIALLSLYVDSAKNELSYQTVTVVYADGGEETFSAHDTISLSIYGGPEVGTLALRDQSGTRLVTAVVVRLFVTANYEGSITGYTITGTAQGRLIYSVTGEVLATLWSSPFGLTGSDLPSGSSTMVASTTVTAGTLEGMYSGWVNGRTYYYDVVCPSPMTVTLHFADGQSRSLTTTPTASRVTFRYFLS